MEIRNYKKHQKGLVLNYMKERYGICDERDMDNIKGEVYGRTYLFKKSVQYAGRSFDITIEMDDIYKDWRGESSISVYSYFFYGSFPWRMWRDQAARVLECLTGWDEHYCKIQAKGFSNFICEECWKIEKDLERLGALAA